jgi:hypothetical protein
MPNWCSNVLTVTGPKKDLATFKKKVRGRGDVADLSPAERKKQPVKCFSLHSTVPKPKSLGDGWYEWCLANWGTKWDVDADLTENDPERLEYVFDSAWAPPTSWVIATSKQFPTLSFRLWYAEGGCDFAGVVTAQNGDYSDESKDFVEAHIEEYGQYNACCEYCDHDVELFTKEDRRICQECAEHVCKHCRQLDKDHVDGKCLLDATTFEALGVAP